MLSVHRELININRMVADIQEGRYIQEADLRPELMKIFNTHIKAMQAGAEAPEQALSRCFAELKSLARKYKIQTESRRIAEALGDKLSDYVSNVKTAQAALAEIAKDLKAEKQPSRGSWSSLFIMLNQIMQGVGQGAAAKHVKQAKDNLKESVNDIQEGKYLSEDASSELLNAANDLWSALQKAKKAMVQVKQDTNDFKDYDSLDAWLFHIENAIKELANPSKEIVHRARNLPGQIKKAQKSWEKKK